MARNFRDFNEDISPTWLKLPNAYGVRFMQGFVGYFADLTIEAAAQATKCGWVRVDSSPDDALPSIGINFNINQAPGESNSAFRARLSDEPGAWTLWEESATGDFAKNVFAAFGMDAADVELHTRNTWTRIEYPDSWSRFWIVLNSASIPWAEVVFGPSIVFGAGWTFGSAATLVDIAGVIDLILKWKSGHEVGVHVILNYYNHLWGSGTWGAPRTWDITGVVHWPLTRFWGWRHWASPAVYRPTTTRPWGGKIKI